MNSYLGGAVAAVAAEKYKDVREEIYAQDRRIIIWGAGERAERFIIEYEVPYDKISFLIDRAPELQAQGFRYILDKEVKRVFAPYIIQTIDVNLYSWVITVGEPEEVIEELKELGVESIYSYPDDFAPLKSRVSLYAMEMFKLENNYRNNLSLADFQSKYDDIFYKGRFILPRVTVSMTTRCVYRCKNCINMIPYYETQEDVPKEDIISDINNIVNNVDEWIFCELIGGEPFLYKDLNDVLEFVLSIWKIRNILIITNGALIPDKALFPLLRNDRVTVRISDYGLGGWQSAKKFCGSRAYVSM